MANREFKIQSDTISLNGVPLSSSVDGKVVIPGVTRSAGYVVDEVDEFEGELAVPNHQFVNQNTARVIDYSRWLGNTNAAVYSVTFDDEGYIDEIEVVNPGAYTVEQFNVSYSFQMYAYDGTEADPAIDESWFPIPFIPKFKASSIESEFGGSGGGDAITSGDNSLAMDEDGNVVFQSNEPFGGINRGIVWEWGVGNPELGLGEDEGSNSFIKQTDSGLQIHPNQPGPMGQGDLRITTGDISSEGTSYTWRFNGVGGLQFPDGTTQTTASTLAPQLTKVEDEIVLRGTLHLGQAAGGSISELDSEGNVNFWFNSATGDLAGRKYAVGNDNNGYSYVICFGTDGSAVWTFTFDQIDFGGSLGQQNVYPFVVKHWTDTSDNNAEYIYVGFDSSSYIGVVKFRIDGTVVNTWVYTHSEDPNLASFDLHDMAIDPENGNFTLVGRMYGEWISYNLVSAQPGTSPNVLVVNRSDVGNPINLGPYDSTDWRIDIDGNGSFYEPSNGGINSFFNLGLYSVSGNGGQQIYTESQHYSAGGIVVDATGTPFLKLYSALWTDTAKRDFLLSLGAGQTYNFACAPGSIYTFTASDVWTADGSDWTLQGSFTQVSGDSLSTAVNITNFYFNDTATGIVRYYIDSDGNSYFDNFNTQNPGSGYTNGEQIKILGSLLGGVDGGFITGLNSVATPVGNTWYFAKNDYLTLDVDVPAGTLVRQGWTGATGTVVSVTDNGQDQWEVVINTTKGAAATGGSVEFYAGNDLIANYGIDYGGYLYNVQWLPVQDIVRFSMDQTLSELPEFNIRQSSGDQGFIYSPGFYHTVGGDGNQGFSSVTLDKDNGIIYAMGDFNIPSQADMTIVAFDYSNGDILWQKNINDNTNWGRAHGIVATNTYVFVPWENDDGETIITKITKEGDHLWSVRQSELDNWDNSPQPLVDSEGNLILAGVMNLYNEQQQSWENEIAIVKISQVDGALIFANSLTRLTARTSVYEYYDSDASPWSIVNDKLFFGGYMNDRNNNYNVGVAVSIPADGTGLGSNGDWEYKTIPFTNVPLFTDYTNDVTLNTQNIPHPDALQISPAAISVTGNTIESIPVLVRAEIIGGSSKFTFEDGGEISQTGIQRHAFYNGNNTITLSADMNGKFLYFANNPNNWSSTIYLPPNANVALPIGFTVTVVMGDFNGQSIYVNNDGNSDVQILANGNNSTGNWWWGFGGDGTAGVYTIMKVDTNVWMLAGPNVWVD